MSAGLALGGNQGGGVSGYQRGIRKRRLDPVSFAILDPAGTNDPVVPATTTGVAILKNLTGNLNIMIAAGIIHPERSNILANATTIPAGAATMQLYPAVNTGVLGNHLFGRAVFQDPAALQNQNHPLAQDLPFSWEFQTESDEVWIQIVVAGAVFAGLTIDGSLCVMATVEYMGEINNEFDLKYMNKALGDVQLMGPRAPLRIVTTG